MQAGGEECSICCAGCMYCAYVLFLPCYSAASRGTKPIRALASVGVSTTIICMLYSFVLFLVCLFK